jgi:hypothetical protein
MDGSVSKPAVPSAGLILLNDLIFDYFIFDLKHIFG